MKKKITLIAALAVIVGSGTLWIAPGNLLAQTNPPSNGTNSVPADAKPKPYPLTTCVVSGEKLGEMGEPIEFVYTNNGENQEIKFCCPMCKRKFLNDPDKYMKIIQDAEAGK
jgi:hypothetical protein